MVTQLVWHYLIALHHGSHYDFNIWAYFYQHPKAHPTAAFRRVLAILARGGI